MIGEAEKIEKEFNVLFDNINYERVDKLIGHSPNFSNADYICKQKNIIVELKVIDKDFFKDGGVIDCVNGFIPVPRNVQPDGQGMYEFRIPEINRNGKVDTMEEPLRRIIKKANKQLKETNKNLLNGNGVGFLILAINMESTIDPSLIQKMTIKILKKEFKSVNGVILCTPKVGLIVEKEMFQPLCLHCQDYNLPKFAQNELMLLADSWCEFIDNGGHG